MMTDDALPKTFEFCFPSLDTLLRVEVSDGEVTIRATRDTFSLQRKASFVRELVSEGFIPEEFQWYSLEDFSARRRGVRWLVDFSWLGVNDLMVAETRRWVLRILGFAVLQAALLIGWTAMEHLGNAAPEAVSIHPHSAR